MQRTRRRLAVLVIVTGQLVLALTRDSAAQLKGHYIPGFTGLQSGSQPPPSINFILPVYWYTTNDIKNDDGQSIGGQPRVNAAFIGAGVAWVTNLKIAGANLGGSVVPIAFLKHASRAPRWTYRARSRSRTSPFSPCNSGGTRSGRMLW
jgi:hypothetical protein